MNKKVIWHEIYSLEIGEKGISLAFCLESLEGKIKSGFKKESDIERKEKLRKFQSEKGGENF